MTSDKTQLAAEIIAAEIDDLMERVENLQRARAILLGLEPVDAIEMARPVQLPRPTEPETPTPAPSGDDEQVDLQDRLLELLTEHHGKRITNAAMAQALGILPASVAQALNALEADGSIRREGNTHSRRIYVAALDSDDEEEVEPVEPPMPIAQSPAEARRNPLAPPPLPSEMGARR